MYNLPWNCLNNLSSYTVDAIKENVTTKLGTLLWDYYDFESENIFVLGHLR